MPIIPFAPAKRIFIRSEFNELMKLSILLAGANGMIGSFLYNRFNKDYSITALDYSKGSIEDNFFSIDLIQEADVETFAEKSPKCYALIFLVGLAHKKGRDNK